jgi:thiamine transport system ATP-binding protein
MLEFKEIHLPRTSFKCEASFKISPGSRVILMGRSGSGKTSLLSLLAGFEKPTQGQILWKGHDLTSLPPQQRPITMLFQNYNLFPHLTVFQNICLGVRPSLKLNTREQQKVMAALEEFQISHLKEQYPSRLSGGEIQRVALARSFLRQCEILILDEPFAALGPRMRQEMIQLLLDLQKKKNLTLFMVTHQPEDALNLGERLIFLEEGHITLDSLLPEALESIKLKSYLAKN